MPDEANETVEARLRRSFGDEAVWLDDISELDNMIILRFLRKSGYIADKRVVFLNEYLIVNNHESSLHFEKVDSVSGLLEGWIFWYSGYDGGFSDFKMVSIGNSIVDVVNYLVEVTPSGGVVLIEAETFKPY